MSFGGGIQFGQSELPKKPVLAISAIFFMLAIHGFEALTHKN